MTHSIISYLNWPFRHQLIEGLQIDLSDDDLTLWLEELGLAIEGTGEIKFRLKKLCSQLFQEKSETLMTLLEHMVQLHLFSTQSTEHIESMNALMPPGIEFSLVSGRILVFSDQLQDPFYAEESHLWQTHDDSKPQETPPEETELTAGLDSIQSRRLKLLENLPTGKGA